MHAIVKGKFMFRPWAVLLLLLCVILFITSCGRHTKAPMSTSGVPARERLSKLPEIQFTIQVGAFSTSVRAAAYAQQLQDAGLDAFYFIDADYLYKVRLEHFDTQEAALERALDLKTRGLVNEFFIVHPRRDRALFYPSMALRESIVQTARRFIGTSYRWGGTSPEEGFDCSGLTMTVYRLNGLDLPRNSRDQFRAGKPVTKKALQAGDLVFFATSGTNRISHVGLYIGHGKFIHAPSQGNVIRTESLNNSYFVIRYQGARCYF
jgi:hypothetical protein